MKHKMIAPLAGAFAAILAPWAAHAAAFDSGSTGTYGPLNVTSNTVLTLPPDGVFHCTTITVPGGMRLRFINNALNTPVQLLATGDVLISGTIDVSGGNYSGGAPGIGGPGGFDGGFGGYGIGAFSAGGDGQGPGGGLAKSGSLGAAYVGNAGNNSNVYGNALIYPLIGGSGGGGTSGNPGYGGGGGGGGGGAILIASNTKITLNGSVVSRGGNGGASGSGGAIRLVSPVVTGSGGCDVNQGGPIFENSSAGRTRIDCEDRFAFRGLTFQAGTTRGSQMFVSLPNPPRLDILQAAGQAIPEGTGNAVQINLPANTSSNQTVTVQARDFTGSVPIRLVVTPENGPSTRIDTAIQMTSNPATLNLPIVVPVGQSSRIHVWTR